MPANRLPARSQPGLLPTYCTAPSALMWRTATIFSKYAALLALRPLTRSPHEAVNFQKSPFHEF
jgi:hypothetical protein